MQTLPVFASVSGSIIIFFLFALIYHAIAVPAFGVKDTPVMVAEQCMMQANFWLALLFMLILALLPR